MTAAEKQIIERLSLDDAKRKKRFFSFRSVYAYRYKGSNSISDNLLLLPQESEPAHRDFLRVKYGMLDVKGLSAFKDFSLVLIGHFNVNTLTFRRCAEKVVLSFNDVIRDLEKVEKK